MFGKNEKLFTPLQHQQSELNMQRKQLHIETVNWFSPEEDHTVCGASYSTE